MKRIPWRRRTPDPDESRLLEAAERRAEHIAQRGHRVADTLQSRLERNHFATLVAQTMTGERT